MYDVIVIGGGLAGLMSSIYLSETKPYYLETTGAVPHSVLLLEKEKTLGGLAASGANGGTIYDRGAAYFTNVYPEENFLLMHIGMHNYTKFKIPEPIDSYYWEREGLGVKIYSDIWHDKTLGMKCPEKSNCLQIKGWNDDKAWYQKMVSGEVLPMSFALFKDQLKYRTKKGFVPNQPIEEADPAKLELDGMSAAQWIQKIPSEVRGRLKTAGVRTKVIMRRFDQELKFRRQKNPSLTDKMVEEQMMNDVLRLMDRYSRSALGAKMDQISAVAFANFYISEIIPRFTTDKGTGFAAEQMENMLRARTNLVKIETESTVVKGGVKIGENGASVTYLQNGQLITARAKYVIFSAQLRFAPSLIEGYASTPAGKLAQEMEYSHYSVHNVEVVGHPYREAYDTWTYWQGHTDLDFTDVINGIWLDKDQYPKFTHVDGKEEREDVKFDVRSFELGKDPQGNGILSVYHPIDRAHMTPYSEEAAAEMAARAVRDLVAHYNPDITDPRKPVGGEMERASIGEVSRDARDIKVLNVKTSRWPFSVHVAAPHHFRDKARILRKPFPQQNPRIFFANSNIGTPAFEEALFRGHCAANNIHFLLDGGKFRPETWTHCPMDADPNWVKAQMPNHKGDEDAAKIPFQPPAGAQ